MTDPVRLEAAPVVIEAIDARGDAPVSLFSFKVPFEEGLDVQDYLERAFVYSQRTDNRDPFVFTLQFYGYDLSSSPRTGFLGYEIASLGKGANVLPSSPQAYWELFIDTILASLGSDLLCPEPGATITWKFVRASDNAPKSLRATLAKALPNST